MKRGIAAETLVAIIALLAFLAVTLVIVFPVIRDALFGAGEQGQCQLSLWLASQTQRTGIKLALGELPAECRTKRMTISMSDLDALRGQAEAAIKDGLSSGDAGYRAQWSDDNKGYAKWALQKKFADELVSCYERAGLGSETVVNGMMAMLGFLPVYNLNDFTCLLCARITLDTEAKAFFQTNKLTDVDVFPWLVYHPVKGQDSSYANYLTQKEPKDYFLYWLSFVSKMKIAENNAIIFGVKNTFTSSGLGGKEQVIGDRVFRFAGASEGVRQIAVPENAKIGSVGIYLYGSVASDFFSGSRDFDRLLLTRSYLGGGKSKCAVIIGD